jgi:hypothetical protein
VSNWNFVISCIVLEPIIVMNSCEPLKEFYSRMVSESEFFVTITLHTLDCNYSLTSLHGNLEIYSCYCFTNSLISVTILVKPSLTDTSSAELSRIILKNGSEYGSSRLVSWHRSLFVVAVGLTISLKTLRRASAQRRRILLGCPSLRT